MAQSTMFQPLSQRPVVNVASVPHRSPFRYPGGKTWLIPYVRQWLRSQQVKPRVLVEPFAGGGIVGLSAAAEDLVERTLLVELDADVASVWQTVIYGDADWLIQEILSLDLTAESVEDVISRKDQGTRERALATIVENRVNRGGILAPGAGRVKNGENGKGLRSRWYPETLCRRIAGLVLLRDKLDFVEGDGLEVLDQMSGESDAVFFIDPPYTVAGRRLYRHNHMDHVRLLSAAGKLRGDSLITYDDSHEIMHIALDNELQVNWVPMKTTHHERKLELLVGKNLDWLSQEAPVVGPFGAVAPQTSAD